MLAIDTIKVLERTDIACVQTARRKFTIMIPCDTMKEFAMLKNAMELPVWERFYQGYFLMKTGRTSQ